MTTSVTITATSLGVIGNTVVLDTDGISTINTLIANWNTANPGNTIALTSGDGSQTPTVGTFASYTGTPTGTTLPITLTANNIGAAGNSIVLTGDGTSTISGLVAAWNAANPGDQVTETAGLGTQTPAIGATMALSGGESPDTISLSGGAAAQPLNLVTSGVVVGDFVTVGSDFNADNQGTFQIISMTPISFSVVNTAAVGEGPITLGASFATQLQIFSDAGVQVGDTLVISSGFSPVSWGSYVITAVYAESLEFSSTAILPQETNILSPVVIYSMAKSIIYMESDQNLTVTVNGVALAAQIQPFVVTNCPTGLPSSALGVSTPGILMLTSTIYSLSVTNNGLVAANVFLAAAE
jgi:hypothetical protein